MINERYRTMIQVANLYHRAIKEGRTEAYKNGIISVCDILGFTIEVNHKGVNITDQFNVEEEN